MVRGIVGGVMRSFCGGYAQLGTSYNCSSLLEIGMSRANPVQA